MSLAAVASALLLLGAGPAAPAPAPAPAPRPATAEVIPPPEGIVAEGLPPLPAGLAAEVRPYTEFRGATFLSWHPRRREVLITTRFADTTQIHQVAFPGGARTQLTFFPDRVARAAYPPDPARAARYFVFSKDVGGSEFNQTYRYDLDGARVTLLTDGRSRNSLGVFANRGDRLAYTSTRRTGADNDLWVMDPADPKSDRLLAEVTGGGWAVLDWSADDRKLVVLEQISVNESYLWIVDAGSGQRTLLTPRRSGDQEPVAYQAARWAPDGKSVYATTDRGSEVFRIVRIDVPSGRLTPVGPALAWDVEELELDEGGRLLAAVVNEDGIGRLRLFDARSGRERPVPPLPPGSVDGIEWRRDRAELAFTMTSGRIAADVFTLDPARRRVERWTESELGPAPLTDLPQPELVRWPTFDGRTLSGVLYKPPARFAGRRPVIVNIHGGPEAQARPGFLGRNNYLVAELGIAMVYPNVRGSTGYGKTFTKLDNGARREDAVKDIGALLDWIRTRPDLDAERVMVTGGSYGGYMSLAVSFHYPERIRCAIDIVGISSFVTFLERTEAYRRDLRRVEYGDERDPAMRAFMQKIAPVANAARIRKPLLIAQGANDPRVPLHEAEQMVATLRKMRVPVWYVMARDEGHGFAKKRNADFLFYATVAFIREHLLK